MDTACSSAVTEHLKKFFRLFGSYKPLGTTQNKFSPQSSEMPDNLSLPIRPRYLGQSCPVPWGQLCFPQWSPFFLQFFIIQRPHQRLLSQRLSLQKQKPTRTEALKAWCHNFLAHHLLTFCSIKKQCGYRTQTCWATLLSGYPGMLPSTIKNNKSDDVFTLCFSLVLDTLKIEFAKSGDLAKYLLLKISAEFKFNRIHKVFPSWGLSKR